MTEHASVYKLNLPSIPLSHQVKYLIHANLRNSFLWLRQTFQASEPEYSSQENRAKYEETWTKDRPEELNQSFSRVSRVDSRLVELPLTTQYAFVSSLIAAEIEAQINRVKEVAEVGAGSGRVLIPLAKKFPEIRFHAIEPTRAGCLKVAESAERLNLQNVDVYCCSAERMAADLQLKVEFVYTNLALEQIGGLNIAELALRNTIALLSSDGFFLFREPWRDINGPLKRSYLRSAKYWPLSTDSIRSITSHSASIELCRIQHNLRFNVGVCRGAL